MSWQSRRRNLVLRKGMRGSSTKRRNRVHCWTRQKNVCALCRVRIAYEDVINGATGVAVLDHIIPVSRGGDPSCPSNLQLLCRHCDFVKADSYGMWAVKRACNDPLHVLCGGGAQGA